MYHSEGEAHFWTRFIPVSSGSLVRLWTYSVLAVFIGQNHLLPRWHLEHLQILLEANRSSWRKMRSYDNNSLSFVHEKHCSAMSMAEYLCWLHVISVHKWGFWEHLIQAQIYLVASTAPMRKRFTPYERRDLLQITCAGFFLTVTPYWSYQVSITCLKVANSLIWYALWSATTRISRRIFWPFPCGMGV